MLEYQYFTDLNFTVKWILKYENVFKQNPKNCVLTLDKVLKIYLPQILQEWGISLIFEILQHGNFLM